MNAILTAEQVGRVLPAEVPVTLVQDVSLAVERGEFVAIMGPSGSGKSSLLYLLGLLDTPTSGRILLDGQDTSGFGEDELATTRLQKLGFVFQFHFLLAEFSVLDNVLLPMRRLGALAEDLARQRAEHLLDQLGLREHWHKRPHQISGGQRQRAAIARALANDPLIILADEPTGNLDTRAGANVRQILHDLTREFGKTVIAVTHDLTFAKAADRQIGIVDGLIDPKWRM
ncbi:Lipoprotein-releasing system ATP-binding protein LolD 2 [Candidatus Competibacter denitrificans Run_A_D11]|uniref:Lipoprotein-releasing system ATP-binding protein LolD 2 n=1 Tax=Candidatus Competibacter denitrificans Run_A_D11 TaxID=1400863 RepID=W6M7E1_9GAMM|nr:ABC transporter ATP-binding protein [Candidatus Competibacter denitrificans]CDI02534.1 Lipoprotein-releasing system ATP-binding protein LolD 2 [Candidatus Competibacter denitrificans Run_A_D11]HRC69523.1 ABC transporter ATP-binding protein [Candidatus Competibacter denitrificans]